MRKLASIQKISKLESIPDADRIEVATILGWKVVVLRGNFEVGSKCAFFEIDSLLPLEEAFEFLAKNGTKKMTIKGKEYEGYRLKTIRLKKQMSQGLALPLEKLNIPKDKFRVGDDITKRLGVVKYEAPIPASLGGKIKGYRPSFVPKTDEDRLQIVPNVLRRHKKKAFYVTEKLDGTSTSIYYNNKLSEDNQFGVCSRNLNLIEDEKNSFWKVTRELKIEETLKELDANLVLQGELMGEGVQGNTLGQKGRKIYFYNVYDIDKGEYVDYKEFAYIISRLELEHVPIIDENFKLKDSVEKMVKYATRKSEINELGWAEGVVVRPLKEATDKELERLSFKVINPEYLLKHER